MQQRMLRLSRNINLFILTTALLLHSITKNNRNHPPLICAAQLLPGDPEQQDYYCGWDWVEANDNCEFHCPSGLDEDCPPLPNGRKRRCIAAAGCFIRFQKLYWTGVFSLSFDKEGEDAQAETTPASTGSTVYPSYEEEDPADQLMTDEETEAFEESFQNYLFEALKEQMQIYGVVLQEQEYNRPCVSAVTGANDPDSKSLDMVIRIVGEYIPVDGMFFTDESFGTEVLQTVNDDPESFINIIKDSSSFFDALNGIAAIEEDSVVEAPSGMPSASPTRESEQTLDIRIDPRPTGSYGIVFNVRTLRGGQTILLTGMSFVTLYDGLLEYEIYSRLGSYEKYISKDSFWELVASGQTKGKGPKAYTPVRVEDTVVRNGTTTLNYVGFQPLHVPGDRGQRSFYVAITKRFTKPDASPIPILFSYPIGSDAEGQRAYEIVDSTPELEVYEGDGVLDHPWPSDRDGPYYRRPRGYIGSFDYDMYPCHPILNFTGWPCPYQRQTKKPTTKPTQKPTAAPVTNKPTINSVVETTQLETDSQTDTDVQTDESDRPELVPGPGVETNDNNATITVGVEEEETNNGAMGSWKAAYRSCGLVALAMYLSW